jgi:hypothetical protein
MRSIKLTGVAAVAIVALFAVTASSALARTGPRFYVGGALLGAVESIEAQAEGNQVLTASGVEIECTGVSVEAATIENPAPAGSPGKDAETLVYSGCTYKGKTAAECEARTKGGGTAGQIKTVALTSELVFQATTGTATDTLFKPGGTEFVSIEFKGTSCPLTETKVKGSVAVENTTANEGKEEVEDVLTAPNPAITAVFTAGGVETKPKLTVTGGFVATYAGKAKVKLSGANVGKKWGVKE